MNVTNDYRDHADSVKDRLMYAVTNPKTGQDVVIRVGNGSFAKEAHSFMLIRSSQVFEQLLEKAEVNNEGFKEIKLYCVQPKALTFALKYIYFDYVDMEDENALEILNVSLKLKLGHLAMLCIAKLRGEITAGNVLHIWEEAVKMNVQELVQISQDFILKNARDVFEREELLNISEEKLSKLLASDELELNEISIFKWLLSWGEAQCERLALDKNIENLRCVLEKILPLIRFPLMTSNQFATVVVPTNILNDKEVIDVYNYLSVMNSHANREGEPPRRLFSSSTKNFTVSEQSMVSENNKNDHNSNALEKHVEREDTEKERLLKYLQEIKQKKTICGLFCLDLADKGIQTIEKITGVQPGILSLEIPHYWDEIAKWQSFTEEIIAHWNDGFLIRIECRGSEHPLSVSSLESSQATKWQDLMEDNGQLNKMCKNKLDAIAPFLKQLQDAGVVVICDLLPYINSRKFLWRGRPGKNGSRKLYQITHDYLTKHHGLHSMLWSWSVSTGGDITNLEEYWPGNNYVDVASLYVENKNQPAMKLYHKLVKVAGNKPMSLECICNVPTPEILANQPGWTWFTIHDRLLEQQYNNKQIIGTTFKCASVLSKSVNKFFKISQFKTSTSSEQTTQTSS